MLSLASNLTILQDSGIIETVREVIDILSGIAVPKEMT